MVVEVLRDHFNINSQGDQNQGEYIILSRASSQVMRRNSELSFERKQVEMETD